MKSKFKVGEIVRQVGAVGSFLNVDPICKITRITYRATRILIYHVHRSEKSRERLAYEKRFEKIPKLLQILYDDF